MAISRQILLLEEELGEPLFLRVGRRVRMTPAGESLVQLGQRVFQEHARNREWHQRRHAGSAGAGCGGRRDDGLGLPLLLKHLKPELDVRHAATVGRLVDIRALAWTSAS